LYLSRSIILPAAISSNVALIGYNATIFGVFYGDLLRWSYLITEGWENKEDEITTFTRHMSLNCWTNVRISQVLFLIGCLLLLRKHTLQLMSCLSRHSAITESNLEFIISYRSCMDTFKSQKFVLCHSESFTLITSLNKYHFLFIRMISYKYRITKLVASLGINIFPPQL